MDGPKRPRLEDTSDQLEDPLNLSLNAAAEYPSEWPALTEMRSRFQQWVLKTYRDSSKTKTITSKKYERIVRTLAGEIKNCAENSKFRFWMKCKGFKLVATGEGTGQFLLVQDKKGEEIKYKKVAVVENFFDIIYDVHVNEGARGMKHAGQKRTHRMITETYAFLPREAVTKFLLCCADCQKRLNEDRKPSPTSSSDSTQPHPIDLQDFQSQPHVLLDQTPSRPSSPRAYACNFTPVPVLHSDNNNDLHSQPYDYSIRLSPVTLEADSMRKRRKRKVTRKIIQLQADYENDNVLDYSSSKPYPDCVATGVSSMEATEQFQTSQENIKASEGYKFSENTELQTDVPEDMTSSEKTLQNTSSCKRQCPFIEKISEVLYNPVKYAMNAQRHTDFPMNEDYLEQSAVDLLLKAHHLETTKEVLTDNDREQIILKIYSCRIISFLLSYAADVMLRLMIDDQLSS